MSLAGLDLNLLKVFDALLREGSTVRAGQRIGLSQPAVSAALARLRQALGDELFVRQGQGLAPTDRARALEGPLRDTLDRLDRLLSAPADWSPGTATEVMRLSGIDFWAEMLMPDLTRLLFSEAPGMRLQLLDLVPDASVEMLDRHQIDIALLPDFDVPSCIAKRPIFHAPFVVVARKDHPRLARAGIAPGGTIPLDLFCDMDHVLLSPDGKLKAMGDAALARAGRERRVAVSVPFFSGVVAIASRTDAIALMPVQLARSPAVSAHLDTYAAPIDLPVPLLVMIWHRRSDTTPAHVWLRDTIARFMLPLNDGLPELPDAH